MIGKFWGVLGLLALSVVAAASLNISASPPPGMRAAASRTDAQSFAGSWTARLNGTPIMVLEVRVEKGRVIGGIRVCSFRINTEGSGKIVEITDRAFSDSLPIQNPEISGKSLVFDWKDPDGDENHLKLVLTGKDIGRLEWIGLPSGLKVEPVGVTRQGPSQR